MYYIFNRKTIPPHEPDGYYDYADMEKVEIIEWPEYDPENPYNWPMPERDQEYWWPLYRGVMSTIPVEVNSIDEARELLLENENEALYEKYHDI